MCEEERHICPFKGSRCMTIKCPYWQKYSEDYYTFTGEIGDCLFKLWLQASINILCPEIVRERFSDTETDSKGTRIKVPF